MWWLLELWKKKQLNKCRYICNFSSLFIVHSKFARLLLVHLLIFHFYEAPFMKGRTEIKSFIANVLQFLNKKIIIWSWICTIPNFDWIYSHRALPRELWAFTVINANVVTLAAALMQLTANDFCDQKSNYNFFYPSVAAIFSHFTSLNRRRLKFATVTFLK